MPTRDAVELGRRQRSTLAKVYIELHRACISLMRHSQALVREQRVVPLLTTSPDGTLSD
jgi:hypothetical protein